MSVDDIESHKSDMLLNFSIAFVLSRLCLYSKPNNIFRGLHVEKQATKFLILLIILDD